MDGGLFQAVLLLIALPSYLQSLTT